MANMPQQVKFSTHLFHFILHIRIIQNGIKNYTFSSNENEIRSIKVVAFMRTNEHFFSIALVVFIHPIFIYFVQTKNFSHYIN